MGRKRVARLMRGLGIEGVTRRRFKTGTTKGDAGASAAPDLVNRDFSTEGPDELWVAEITQVRAGAGWLYVAVVLDAWSRRIVGWAMASRMPAELVGDALKMAISTRQPKGPVIHHSDRGSQYTSLAFGERCREAGVVQSMGSVGDAYDNAMCESLFATLECELLDGRRFRTAARSLQLHRGLLQHPPTPLGAGLSLHSPLRATSSCGLKRTWGAGPVALTRFACPPAFRRRETRHPNAGPIPPPLSARERQPQPDTINPKN